MAHCGGFGILAAVLGVLFVAKLVRRIVRHRMGYGGGCGHRGGFGRRGFGRGPGGSWWLRGVFAKLDTTPGQEREIRNAIEDFQRTARDAKDGLRGARSHLATAMKGADLDESAFVQANATAEDAATKVKDAMAAALRRVHAVLDPHQRTRLADLIERGRGGWRRGGGGFGGPYRDAAM